MKIHQILTLFMLFCCSFISAQNVYDAGEQFKFKISYGFVNAGVATLELKNATIDGKSVFHAKGIGYTTGITKTFFKVYDDYQSYFDKSTGKPYRYVRKIDEGGYTKNQEGFFNQSAQTVLVKDYKHKNQKTLSTTANVQDIVSAFYYLRNQPGITTMKKGESIQIDMFFDDEIYKFKLKFLGKEEIKTNFGKINALKFRPYVQAGRVFKEQESLTVWISDDANRVPLKIQASLLVGSLKAELSSYKGLKYNLGTK